MNSCRWTMSSLTPAFPVNLVNACHNKHRYMNVMYRYYNYCVPCPVRLWAYIHIQFWGILNVLLEIMLTLRKFIKIANAQKTLQMFWTKHVKQLNNNPHGHYMNVMYRYYNYCVPCHVSEIFPDGSLWRTLRRRSAFISTSDGFYVSLR